MKYTVGKYVVVPEKPFSSMQEAVQHIQERHPELARETIEEYLNPEVNGIDKPNDSVEKSAVSKEVDAKDSTAVTDRVKPSSNKPR